MQIDHALERWVFAMGPLMVMDISGQGIGWSIRKRRAVEQPGRSYSPLPDRICELGRYGQKSSAGCYLYPQGGRVAVEDPLVTQFVLDHSAAIGTPRRRISDQKTVERCLCATINKGARIIEEGIAAPPLDIDAV